MVLCNYAEMTLTAKIVYYGPGLGGKTTNLNHIHGNTAREARGEMVSLNTDTERTLFFDLLPVAAGSLGGFKAQIQLYTVPGQVFYNAMRKIVLNGADGIVFVADSQRSVQEVNRQSFENLKVNLEEAGVGLEEIPLVFQFNKRDLPEVLSVEELNHLLNPDGKHEWFEACAARGLGVFETLEGISRLTFRAVRERFLGEGRPSPDATGATTSEADEPATSAKPPKAKPPRKRPAALKNPPPVPTPAAAEVELLPVVSGAVQLSLDAPAPPAEMEPVVAEAKADSAAPAPAEAPAPPPPAPADQEAEDWEISFGDDQAGRRGRRELNLMAELEKLRIHVGGSPTSPRPAEKKARNEEPAAALDQLVAATLGRPKPAAEPPIGQPAPVVPGLPQIPWVPAAAAKKERGPAPATFQFDVSLPQADGRKLRRLVLLLQPEGASREPMGPVQEYVVDLESTTGVETLLLSLKVDLKGPSS